MANGYVRAQLFFNSKNTQLRCPANSVGPTKLPFGRFSSHISRKANRATGRFGLPHQREWLQLPRLAHCRDVTPAAPGSGQLVGQRFMVKQRSTQLN